MLTRRSSIFVVGSALWFVAACCASAADPEPAATPASQPALVEVPLILDGSPQTPEGRAAAIDYLSRATERFLQDGQLLPAAQALRQRADLFMGFDGWERLTTLAVDPPRGWGASRRLQRTLAIESLDRALLLGGDHALAAEAAYRKAALYVDYLERGDAEVALLACRTALQRWPEHRDAPWAAFEIAEMLERDRDDSVAAAEQYGALLGRYPNSEWAARAALNRREILSPALSLFAVKQVKPGDSGDIHFAARNVPRIVLRAFRVDLFELAQQTDALQTLGTWSPAGAPVATWDVPLAEDGRHHVFDSQRQNGPKPTRLPVTEAGAYVIVGEGGAGAAHVQAATLMLVTDLAVTCTSSPQRCLVFAAAAGTGGPQRQADVLLMACREKRPTYSLTGTTDDAGVCTLVHPEKLEPYAGRTAHVYARRGEQYAACEVQTSMPAGPPAYRVYTITDRPVYRPGQTVKFKQIIRRVLEDGYDNVTNRTVVAELHDAAGQTMARQTLLTGEFGTVSGEWRLSDTLVLGDYLIHPSIQDEPDEQVDRRGGSFRVEEYRRPEFEVSVSDVRSSAAPQAPYRMGDEVEALVAARYYYGSPVANAEVTYKVYRTPFMIDPDERPAPSCGTNSGANAVAEEIAGYAAHWRRELVANGSTTTDANGNAHVKFGSAEIEHTPEADLEYTIEVEVTDAAQRVIDGRGAIRVAHTPFFIRMSPRRAIYRPGEAVQIELRALTANGEPFRFRGRARFYRWRRYVVEVDRREDERFDLGDEVHDEQITLDEHGCAEINWVPQLEGPFRVVVTTQNKDGLTVKGACTVWVVQTGGRYPHYAYRELETLVEHSACQSDEPLRVMLNTKFDNAYVLLTLSSTEIVEQRVVFVPGGSTALELPARPEYAPQVLVRVSLLRDRAVYADSAMLSLPPLHRGLDVRLSAGEGVFRPQQRTRVQVNTRAAEGRPAPADVTLFAVDASLYESYPVTRADIRDEFYGLHDALGPTLDAGASVPAHGTSKTDGAFGDVFGFNAGGSDEDGVPDAEAKHKPPLPPREVAPAVVRRSFSETILWLPNLRTDREGQASAELAFPDTLTTWAVHAVAVDCDTRVGEARLDLITRKDVLVRLEAPRFLVDRDRATITAVVTNDLDSDKTVEVELRASDEIAIGAARLNDRPLPYIKTRTVQVVIPAHGERAVEFDIKAQAPDTATLTAWARTNSESDATELRIPILTYGVRQVIAHSGALHGSGEAAIAFELPEKIDPRSPQLTVTLNPSIARVALDALPYVLEYPYGCTEQTLDRFLPAVAVGSALQQLDVKLGEIKRHVEAAAGPNVEATLRRLKRAAVFDGEELERIGSAGLKKLAEMQHADGAWGWWADDQSDPYMTALVLYGECAALRAKVAVEREPLARAAAWLRQRLSAGDPPDINLRAWMLFALAGENSTNLLSVEMRSVLNSLYESRMALTDHTRALLLMMLQQLGDAERTSTLLAELQAGARVDASGNLAYWGNVGGTHWYDNAPEATATVLRALLLAAPHDARVPQALNWIVQARRGAEWRSTRESSFAIAALTEYLARSGELGGSTSVTLRCDDGPEQAFSFAPEDVLWNQATVQLEARDLKPGPHTLTVRTAGDGNLYFSARTEFFATEDPMAPAGGELTLSRQYAKLVARRIQKSRTIWDEKLRRDVEEQYAEIEDERVPIEEGESLRLGDRLEVRLEITAANEIDYLMLNDPKPAGCEATDLVSARRSFSELCAHVEPHDRELVFFISHLAPGSRTLTHSLRCETAGAFTALPAQVEAMYAPELHASSASHRLTIVSGAR